MISTTNVGDWHQLCITDKTGQQHFKCAASPMSTMSEIRNLKRHLEQAKKNPESYWFIDVDSAVILLDGVVYCQPTLQDVLDDDELLGLLK